MRRFRVFDGFAIAAAFAAQPALAQINEADRLARCQNNRDALARLEAARGTFMDDEQIARANTALRAIQALEAQINSIFFDANTVMNFRSLAEARPASPSRTIELADFDAQLRDMTRRNGELGERIRVAAEPFGLACAPGDYACSRQLQQALARLIETAVAQRSQYPALLRQIAAHQTNLIALNCDTAAAGQTIQSDSTGVPNFAGTWVDSDNRQFIISQSGADVTMSLFIFGRQESAQGSWSGGRLNLRWMAGNPPVPQQGSATVVTRGGVAVEIDFGGGFRYVRQ